MQGISLVLFKHKSLFLGLVFASFFGACQRNSAPESKTLRIGISNEIRTLDIRNSRDRHSYKIFKLFTQSLLNLDKRSVLIPELAVLKEKQENQVFTFKLNKSYFHNGRQVEVEDVIASFKDASHSKSPLLPWLEKIAEFKKISKNELQIHLQERSASFLKRVIPSIGIMPREILKNDKSEFKAIGSGPYKIEKQSYQQIVLSRNETYTPKPFYDNIIIKSVLDSNTRLLALMNNELDILWGGFSLEKINLVKNSKFFRVHQQKGQKLFYLGFNFLKEKWKNKRNRTALAGDINKEKIIEEALSSQAEKADSIFPQNSIYHIQPEKIAKDLIKNKNIEISSASIQEMQSWIPVLKKILKEKGWNISLKNSDFAHFLSRIKRKEFDVFLFYIGTHSDPSIFQSLFTKGSIYNRMSYNNPLIEKLFKKDHNSENEIERLEYYAEIQRILAKDLPIIPLFFPSEILISNRQINPIEESNKAQWMELIFRGPM